MTNLLDSVRSYIARREIEGGQEVQTLDKDLSAVTDQYTRSEITLEQRDRMMQKIVLDFARKYVM